MLDQDTPQDDQPETVKRAYERPEIVDYGSVRELTRGTGSKPQTDMAAGTRRK